MRNCWLTAIAGQRADAPSNISHEGPTGMEGGGGAWPGNTQHQGTAGVKGAGGSGGPGCGAGGRWQGLQDNEPTPTTHQHTDPTGVGSAGGSGGHGWPDPTAPGIPARQGCGARGRRQGLAGQRADTPSEARSADGSRAGRRPRAHQAARPSKAHHTGGRVRRRSEHQRRHKQRAPDTRKPRPADAGRGQPTQSGGKV